MPHRGQKRMSVTKVEKLRYRQQYFPFLSLMLRESREEDAAVAGVARIVKRVEALGKGQMLQDHDLLVEVKMPESSNRQIRHPPPT